MTPHGQKAIVLFTALAVLVASSAALDSSPALADDSSKAVRKLVKKGDKYLRRGDQRQAKRKKKRALRYYKKALAAYQKAQELAQTAELYLNIADVEVRLERYVEAIDHYQKAAAEGQDEDLKKRAAERIEALKQQVAIVTLVIEPEGAELSINGEQRGKAPIQDAIFLPTGQHTFTVTADGYVVYEETINLEAGSESERKITLEKSPVRVDGPKSETETEPETETETEPETETETEPEDPKVDPDAGKDSDLEADPDYGPGRDDVTEDRRRPRRVFTKPGRARLIIGGSLTLAFSAGAVITGFTARAKHSTFTDENQLDSERESARDSGKRLALITDALLVGAVLAGGYTAYHYLVTYRPEKRAYEEQERRKDPDFLISPYFDGRGVGVAASGRF